MANITYVQWVQPSCPHSTAAKSYTTTKAGIATVFLWRMEVRIPAGHQGLTGIALVDSAAFAIPYDPGGPAWLIGDDDLLEYDYNKELGANVVLATYNTDTTNNHIWQVRLIYTPMSDYAPDEATIEVSG